MARMSSGESEFPSFDNEDFLFITKANVASFVSSYRSHCQLFYDLVRLFNFAPVGMLPCSYIETSLSACVAASADGVVLVSPARATGRVIGEVYVTRHLLLRRHAFSIAASLFAHESSSPFTSYDLYYV